MNNELIEPKNKISKFISQLLNKYSRLEELYISSRGMFVKEMNNIKKIRISNEKIHPIYLSFFNLLTSNQKEKLKEKHFFKITEELNNLKINIKIIYYKEQSGFSIKVKIRKSKEINIFNLGYKEEDINKLININKTTSIAVIGYNNSGKTTFLYGIAKKLGENLKNHILIIEDKMENILYDNDNFIVQKEFNNEIVEDSTLILNSIEENPDYMILDKINYSNKKEYFNNIKMILDNGIKVYFTINSSLFNFLKELNNIYNENIPNIKYILNQKLILNKKKEKILIYELIDLEKIKETISLFFNNKELEINNINLYSILEKEGIETINTKLKKLLEKDIITEEEYFKNLIQ